MLVLLSRVCTHVRLDILAMSLCLYVCVVVEGMYTFKTRNFYKVTFCLCLCCCRGYVNMYNGPVWHWLIALMVLVDVEGMFTCETGNFGSESL